MAPWGFSTGKQAPPGHCECQGPGGPDWENLSRCRTNPLLANALDRSPGSPPASLLSCNSYPFTTVSQNLPDDPGPFQPMNLCPYYYFLLKSLHLLLSPANSYASFKTQLGVTTSRDIELSPKPQTDGLSPDLHSCKDLAAISIVKSPLS